MKSGDQIKSIINMNIRRLVYKNDILSDRAELAKEAITLAFAIDLKLNEIESPFAGMNLSQWLQSICIG